MNDVAKDRNIAMVFNHMRFILICLFDNMAFGLKLRKFSRDEIDRRVQSAAETRFETLLDRKPKLCQAVNVNGLLWAGPSFGMQYS